MGESYLSATEVLRQKFRSLISLTQIVSAINNDGHPTLRSASDYNTNIALDRQIRDDILDAIADILIRNEEVVAVAFSGSTIVAMQGQEEQEVGVTTGGESDSANAKQWDAEQLDAEQLDARQSDSAADNELDFGRHDYSDIVVSGISAIVNPQPEDANHYDFPEGCQCMLIPEGKSHLPKARLAPDQLCNRFLKKIK
jgi:hypothetical protein